MGGHARGVSSPFFRRRIEQLEEHYLPSPEICQRWKLGYCGRHDYRRRLFLIRAAIVATLMIPTLCFFLVEEPVLMVKIGGVAQTLMLPVIGFSAIYLGRQRLSDTLAPKRWIRLALWFSAVVMLAAAAYYLIATYL